MDGLDRQLSSTEVQAMQEAGDVAAWVLTSCGPRYPSKLVARAHSAPPEGGQSLGAVLVANSLEALCAQLPHGISQHDVNPGSMPSGLIELWA